MALDYLVCLHLVDVSDSLPGQNDSPITRRESTEDMDRRRGWSQLSDCITPWPCHEVELSMAILAASSVFPLQVQVSQPEPEPKPEPEEALVANIYETKPLPCCAREKADCCTLRRESGSPQLVPSTVSRHDASKFFPFDQTPLQDAKPYTFTRASACSVVSRAQKRSRPLSDVDGPRTACQPSKKRRLLRQMFSSPLSAASSAPASHAINRTLSTAVATRNLGLSAIIQARRVADSAGSPPVLTSSRVPSQSEMYRRAAIINRYRLAMLSASVARTGADPGHFSKGKVASATDNLGLSPAVPPAHVTPSSRPDTISVADKEPPALQVASPKHGGAAQLHPGASHPGSDMVRPTASTISRLPPRLLKSPLLRPASPKNVVNFEPLDDESDCAFPTSAHESRYEDSDDPDEVYADFGAIFGGGGVADADSDLEGENEGYEDVMDELDGIPWGLR